MSCDVATEACDADKAAEGLKHEFYSFSNLSVTSPTSQLILQPFCHFTYATAHSSTLPPLYLRHSSFSNPFVASPTSQLIPQPFFRFSYVTGSSPGEQPMEGINSGSHNTFLTTQGHGGPPRMRDQLNAGTSSETTRT